MMIKKKDNMENNLSSLFEKTKDAIVKVADQNNDGELNLDDVAHLAENVSFAARKAADTLGEKTQERIVPIGDKLESAKLDFERKMLQPIFFEDLDGKSFKMPKMIRIAEPDKKHVSSKACEGAIGNRIKSNDMTVLHIYTSFVDKFGITLFPNTDAEIYYVDPCDKSRYIALDNYFKVLKVARINELQKIAQDLGAKHFKVTYIEQKKTFASRKIKSGAKFDISKLGGLSKTDISAETESSSTEYEKMEIAAELSCEGHDPIMPELLYYEDDDSIRNLISMRRSDNKVRHHSLMLNFSSSSGINVRQAVKIDEALKMMNLKGNASVQSEAESEERRMFRYEIDF